MQEEPGGVIRIVFGNEYFGQLLHVLGDANAVQALQVVVQLLVEVARELVQQPHHVQAGADGREIP